MSFLGSLLQTWPLQRPRAPPRRTPAIRRSGSTGITMPDPLRRGLSHARPENRQPGLIGETIGVAASNGSRTDVGMVHGEEAGDRLSCPGGPGFRKDRKPFAPEIVRGRDDSPGRREETGTTSSRWVHRTHRQSPWPSPRTDATRHLLPGLSATIAASISPFGVGEVSRVWEPESCMGASPATINRTERTPPPGPSSGIKRFYLSTQI